MPDEMYIAKIGRARAAFEQVNDSNGWRDGKTLRSYQMLKQLVEALGIHESTIRAPNHEPMLRYVSDVNVDDVNRRMVIDALASRLCFCGDQELAEILVAFDKMHLLPQLTSDPRVGHALMLNKISKTQPILKELADIIVSNALLLPQEHCRQVLSVLDRRGVFTTIEVERTAIDDALKAAKYFVRLPFSF